MNPLATSLLIFACTFGGALLGMFLRRVLPEHHVGPDSKEVIRVGMGLVATTVALVLGLLVYSSKSFFDTQTNEVTQLAANVLLLDRVLAHYGPETAAVRAELKNSVSKQIDAMWPEEGARSAGMRIRPPSGDVILDEIHALVPQNDRQKQLQSQAVSLALQMGQTRFLMYEQRSVPVPKVLLVMLAFWLIALFASFGLFAPANYTVVLSLLVAAAAICGAVFLLMEMYYPYGVTFKYHRNPCGSRWRSWEGRGAGRRRAHACGLEGALQQQKDPHKQRTLVWGTRRISYLLPGPGRRLAQVTLD